MSKTEGMASQKVWTRLDDNSSRATISSSA
jgi:hypothetical protein